MWYIKYANCTGYTTPFTCRGNYDKIIGKLEIDVNRIWKLFKHNGFQANTGKVHFFAKFVQVLYKINAELLVFVTTDSCLTFKEHVINVCSNLSSY